MSRQSEYKKRFNPEMGRYTRQHIYGEGMMDVFKNIGSKLIGKTVKSAAKKGVERAMTTAATKTGEHVGKKAGDKIVSLLSKEKKPTKSKWGDASPQNPPAKKLSQQQRNARVNTILSGGKII